jgi:hypothetical protein
MREKDLGFINKGGFMKTMTKIKYAALMVAATMTLSFMVACGEAPTGQSYNVDLLFGSYSTVQNSPLFWKLFGPKEAQAAVTTLKMCFKRLRIKPVDEDSADPAADSANVDFELGEVTVSNAGTSLGTISVPEGEYRRIEFDLESNCASGKSLQLTNANGTFSTNERITIKFSGVFNADADGVLNLGVQNILDALNSYTAPASLRDTAEAVSGVLSN